MNHQDIISQKIEYLNGNCQQDLTAEAKAAVKADVGLASEIQFIEEIWNHRQLDNNSKPSAQMQARFYQMLSHAQSVETTKKVVPQAEKEPLLVRLGLFKPAFQALLVLVVFSVGWSLNSNKLSEQTTRSAELEDKVDALNVMVALSMLHKDSTAERLAGIDYAKNIHTADAQLTDSLMTLLNSDRSSAVRLSVIDVLANQQNQNLIKDKIVDSLARQSNAIVQVSLVELLQNSSGLTEQQLDKIFSNKQLDSEVVKLLNEHFSADQLI